MSYYPDEKPPWQLAIWAIIILAILWFLETITGTNAFNEGVCKQCGGEYIYQQAVGHRYSTNYIYKCDTCGNVIEINHYIKGEQ